jgi:hypothetical protein
VLLPNAERIHSLLVEFYSLPTPDVDAVAAEGAQIQIVSGNKQLGDVAAVELKRQGLAVTDSQTSPTLAASSSIVVYHAKPATVQRLISLLRINPANVRTVNNSSDGPDLQVILGRDYNSCQK